MTLMADAKEEEYTFLFTLSYAFELADHPHPPFDSEFNLLQTPLLLPDSCFLLHSPNSLSFLTLSCFWIRGWRVESCSFLFNLTGAHACPYY